MTQTIETTDRLYIADYEAQSAARADEPQWLQDVRRQGIEAFKELGFPVARKGNEDWKYTDIRPIARAEFRHPSGSQDSSVSLADLPFDEGMARIVFIDGLFSPGLSRLSAEGVTIQPLSEAFRTDGPLLSMHFAKSLEPRHGAFTALNTALFRDGAFIHVLGEATAPVHVVHVTGDATDDPVTYPRTLVVAAPMSKVTLIETYVSAGERRHFTASATEISLGAGANVEHYRLLLENQQAFHVGHVRATHDRDSSFKSLAFTAGAGLARIDLEVLLAEPGSSANLKGLYVTAGKQHIDHLVNIDHAAPHAMSRLYYKGILDEQSRAVFGGMVMVRKGADKTDAHQEDKNLLLSHEAEADSKPSLEIYADDVKAGHGATAGAIADEALFYLRSRGIDEETAWQFLVRGFATEILDTVTIETLRVFLEERTLQSLPRFRGKLISA